MLFLDKVLAGSFWEATFFGNSMAGYAEAVVIFVVALIVLKIVQTVVISRLRVLSKKTKTDIDDTLVEIVDSIRPGVYTYIALYLGLRFLELSTLAVKVINVLLLIVIVYQVVAAVQILINHVVQKKLKGGKGSENAGRFLAGIAKFVLWSIGLLLILQNVGVNVTSLIAGLGIGGLAIAFALQKILEDLFSSFAIIFDKPFVVGDMIKVGDVSGNVEKIGIKTTRLRSSQGEEIIMSNRELTDSRVHNFGRLKERRVTLTFGVLYETPQKKLEQIPEMVKGVIDGISEVRSHRAHFTEFGDSSLDFTVTYYIESDDYDVFLNKQQEVNFDLRERFEKEGIEMAYPTRTIYMNK